MIAHQLISPYISRHVSFNLQMNKHGQKCTLIIIIKKTLYIILKDCSIHSVRGDFSLASVTYTVMT